MAITLTESAAKHVARYLERRGKGIGLRLGVKTTGCSGLAYKLEYADDAAPEDHTFESHGVKVLVDPRSLSYIDGTELDFVREGLNEGFRFNNPNVKSECGCGESFKV
jgi:iron-sulfur cluster assembly protein